MAGPITNAGQAFVDDWAPVFPAGERPDEYDVVDRQENAELAERIAAIEAEAVTTWLESEEGQMRLQLERDAERQRVLVILRQHFG